MPLWNKNTFFEEVKKRKPECFEKIAVFYEKAKSKNYKIEWEESVNAGFSLKPFDNENDRVLRLRWEGRIYTGYEKSKFNKICINMIKKEFNITDAKTQRPIQFEDWSEKIDKIFDIIEKVKNESFSLNDKIREIILACIKNKLKEIPYDMIIEELHIENIKINRIKENMRKM